MNTSIPAILHSPIGVIALPVVLAVLIPTVIAVLLAHGCWCILCDIFGGLNLREAV